MLTAASSNGNVEVTIAAEAAKALKDVTLLAMAKSWRSSPMPASTSCKRQLSSRQRLSLGAGKHDTRCQSDRLGRWCARQNEASDHPCQHSKEPTVSLDHRWRFRRQPYLEVGTDGVLVLQGNVSNEENLAAVQVKVGDQGYIDAQFGDGSWGVAYPVVDPENKTLPISVRAIDKAGNMTRIGEGSNCRLCSPPTAPETTIAQAPPPTATASSASLQL